MSHFLHQLKNFLEGDMKTITVSNHCFILIIMVNGIVVKRKACPQVLASAVRLTIKRGSQLSQEFY